MRQGAERVLQLDSRQRQEARIQAYFAKYGTLPRVEDDPDDPWEQFEQTGEMRILEADWPGWQPPAFAPSRPVDY